MQFMDLAILTMVAFFIFGPIGFFIFGNFKDPERELKNFHFLPRKKENLEAENKDLKKVS